MIKIERFKKSEFNHSFMTQFRIKIDSAVDYYQILQVDPRADERAIKSAYRRLAKQHHPDRGGDEELFKRTSEAYFILSDPQRRRTYDGLRSSPSGHSRTYGIDDQRFYEAEINIDASLKKILEGLHSRLQQILTVAGLGVTRNGHDGLNLMEGLFIESLEDVRFLVKFYGVEAMYEPKIRILEQGWATYKGLQARYAPQQAASTNPHRKTKRPLEWLLDHFISR